jgi:hypothetical protein
MKLWEKVNNITGNNSKARFLIEYINAGSKFLMSSLPEKWLWTIATETEISGWSSAGISLIGAGSDVAYDKILAVYRYQGTKRRIAKEIPDKFIHSTDESDSLSLPTKMFPVFYKLNGKIFIKPDPDYNLSSSQQTYTPVGGSSTNVGASSGDKGVVVYSAPPIIDENTENWVLSEYENVTLHYAASLDMLRLASVSDAEKILEGGYASVDATSKTSLSAIHWLEDEDPEMANAVIQVSQGDLSLANQRLQQALAFYQRAVAELRSITGALAVPEQQQQSQRKEQGMTT